MNSSRIVGAFPIASALIGMSLMSMTAFIHAEDVYKSTDAQGRPVYSDRPLSSRAERLNIQTKPSTPAAAQTQAKQEIAELNRRQDERDRQLAAEAAAKQAKEAAERAQAERCVAARNRYLNFSEGRRIYRRDEAGERVYYTGAEIDAERQTSKQQMEEACADLQR